MTYYSCAVNILASALYSAYIFEVIDILWEGSAALVRLITGVDTEVDVNIVLLLYEGTDTTRYTVIITVPVLEFAYSFKHVFEYVPTSPPNWSVHTITTLQQETTLL